LAH
jgi:hypothetical protein